MAQLPTLGKVGACIVGVATVVAAGIAVVTYVSPADLQLRPSEDPLVTTVRSFCENGCTAGDLSVLPNGAVRWTANAMIPEQCPEWNVGSGVYISYWDGATHLSVNHPGVLPRVCSADVHKINSYLPPV